jgi:inosose dehydratase
MSGVGYLTMGDEDVLLESIAKKGYKYFEIFEGNLLNYESNPQDFDALMAKHDLTLLGVYIGCHFIYPDALPDEMAKVEKVTTLAKRFGAKYIVLGGGSIRAKGIQEEDYKLCANGIDSAAEIITQIGLIPAYHPHLGSLAQTPEQIHKLFALTNIAFCPDVAHLIAGGSDVMALLEKYFDRIPYIHLKDYDGTNFVPLGKGTAPITEIVQFLLDKNYDGDWLVEIDGYPGCPDEACETSYNFLKGKLI